DASATRYEMFVNKVEDEKSRDYGKFVVTVLNFGECFVLNSLRNVGTDIYYKSKNGASTMDCANIQNIVASKFDGVEETEYTAIK
ncbi:hypothetical protein, partial [Bacillus mycoides]|uniref:hypothetical protein n=1 Tax=Bacillus mycoides TaxID=1405 RepID=UPI003A8048FC